jgi:predicted Zn finger-like uncharacterized protein
MRLTCPSCGAEYEVPDGMVPAAGRHVQCTACHARWFVRGQGGGLARALSEDQILDRLETLTTRPRPRPRPVAVPDPEPLPEPSPPAARPAKPAERPNVPRPAPVAETPPPLSRPARLEIAAEPTPTPPAPEPRRRSLFLQGLVVALVICGLAVAAYVWRGPIAGEIPAAAPALDRYARLVDELRARIEEYREAPPSEQVE